MTTLRFAVLLVLAAWLGGDSAVAADGVFDMREVSLFADARDKADPSELPIVYSGVYSGMYAWLERSPESKVKKYPTLKSAEPLYGAATLGESDFDPTAGKRLYVALDESSPGSSRKAGSSSFFGSLFGRLMGRQPARRTYDRLYVDANLDLELTNDSVLSPMKDGASKLGRDVVDDETVVFEFLTLSMDFGPELGMRPVRVLPILVDAGYGDRVSVRFVLPIARKGDIRIGERQYTAILSQQDTITGRFDHPLTHLQLIPKDRQTREQFDWLRGGMLCTMREEGGQLYQLKTTPLGDKLIVEAYRGEYGILEVGAGGRKTDRLGAAGALYSKNFTIVSLGKTTDPWSAQRVQQQRLPVGDYRLMHLSVDMGQLRMSVAPNRYAWQDGAPAEKSPSFSLPIRKDKPCVLDFAHQPKVVFVDPKPGETVRAGEGIRIEAVLVDPSLDVMITDIEDTTKKTRNFSYTDENGKKIDIIQFASLDPLVEITDSKGKQVASGSMPFG